ncbi:hypothetical protein HYDPIDRAFT_186524 [Hydnomerulius pinastri MD-312]|nr:hypothetical protein HYDPIDRAFT_186524 [Hydnomerulius pinastri MD-312]
MSYTYPSAYPLTFPSESQRTPMKISTYSSLANALGPNPEYPIYLTNPPVSNPSYPYPARNVLNPGTYSSRTPLLASNGRHPSNPGVVHFDEDDHKGLPSLPSRYKRFPQPMLAEPVPTKYSYQAGVEFPAIHFQRKGGKEPHSIGSLLDTKALPDLVGGDVPVFASNPDRYIKIRLVWPGYTQYPFEKRINIKQGAPFTPTLMLMTLVYYLDEFVRWLHNQEAGVEPGQEQWAVRKVLEGAPAMWKDCVITSLYHRTGSVWQPELYYPRR